MTWQPIDTAPKDGRTIILWIPAGRRREARPAFGRWWRKSCDPETKGFWTGEAVNTTPTHWMAAPEGPDA